MRTYIDKNKPMKQRMDTCLRVHKKKYTMSVVTSMATMASLTHNFNVTYGVSLSSRRAANQKA